MHAFLSNTQHLQSAHVESPGPGISPVTRKGSIGSESHRRVPAEVGVAGLHCSDAAKFVPRPLHPRARYQQPQFITFVISWGLFPSIAVLPKMKRPKAGREALLSLIKPSVHNTLSSRRRSDASVPTLLEAHTMALVSPSEACPTTEYGSPRLWWVGARRPRDPATSPLSSPLDHGRAVCCSSSGQQWTSREIPVVAFGTSNPSLNIGFQDAIFFAPLPFVSPSGRGERLSRLI